MRHLVSVLFLFGSPLLAQQTLWVDAAAGNDANPGTAAQPLRSITRAVALAGNGDRIWVEPGTYGPTPTGEVLPIRIGGAPQNGLELRAIGPAGAVIVDLEQSQSQLFTIDQGATGAHITGFVFINADTTQWWTRVIDTAGNASAVEIERCRFAGVNRGIVIWGANGQISGMRIHHNVFDGLTNDAINEFGSNCNNEIANNTIVGSAQGPNYVGILIEGGQSKIHDNIVVGMRDGISVGMGVPGSHFTGNDLWSNVSDWVGTVTTAPPGNFAVDPKFVSVAQRDFHLQSSSSLIEVAAGPALGSAAFDGAPVVIDGNGDGVAKPDVGALEWSPGRFTVSSGAGKTTFTLTGAPGVGFVLFAGDAGQVPLPGGSLALLDLASLFPVVVTGGLPLSVSAPTPVGFAGARVVSQGFVLNPTFGTLDPAQAVWSLF